MIKQNGSRPILVLIVALAAAVHTCGCGLWETNDGSSIRISGNIELTQVNIAFKTAGRLVDLPIEEGAEVRQGEIVARLDADQLQKQHARERASLAVAESQMDQQKRHCLSQGRHRGRC